MAMAMAMAMASSLPLSISILSPALSPPPRLPTSSRSLPIVSKAGVGESKDVGPVGYAAIASSVVANPMVAWSLYTLKTTGCGLPPGPAGSIGALEGFSYLVIAGIVGWSVYTKVRTGSGLPSGPFGLLGVMEGISYLSLVAIAVVFGLQYLDYGYIPGPVPGKECFG
eukprot:c16878_g1_i1 orf=43-546(+)